MSSRPSTCIGACWAHRRWVLPVVLASLAGCVVGPDYSRPVPSPTAGYTRSPLMLPSAGRTDVQQHIVPGEQISGRWWTLFQSRELDDTMTMALAGSPTLDTARATLAEARQAIAAARGGHYPQIDLGASVARARVTAGSNRRSNSRVENLFSIGPTVSFDADLFGRVPRQIEEQIALAQVAQYELAAAWLTLTGNAVIQAVDIASAREQIRAVEDIISVDEHNLELVRIEREAGKAATTDVLSAQSQLAADRTLLPPLEQQLSEASDALTILVGKTPAEWTPPRFDLERLYLPNALPVTVPSRFVRDRPDILAAEARLHAANAAIGVATAQLYPNIALTASWTQAAGTVGELFDRSSGLWSVAGGLTAPLFHGGTLKAQRQEAVDAFAAQLGIYRQTVLSAFGQVADTLRALEHDAAALDAQRNALDAAQASLALSQASYQYGQSSFIQVLEAQRLFGQARVGYAKSKGQRYIDTAQLFVSMGGGWQSWDDPAMRPSAH
ncbi:efflux transporter outer membrane subunit [Paraburkholderia sp. NMBU_R16]|uniref:efflux transporter outer membrane subunit n=1 Tax=Paraburkholderia sp. NMBU_R16 TaxID=2698676 RepID=UPI00156331D1|nr:efflux transporter outer membrane subunit [Paraburkholderia sp. NMBU_R16]NRO96972.1 efflux transporter outer membrane subunit [Paraburkholderia sp. NMBU_R16]